MKKIILYILILSATLTVNAQYREVKLPDAPKQTKHKNYEMENSGFWCAADAEFGSSIMKHSTNMQYTNIAFTGGYRFNEFLRFGAGLGIRYYVHNANVRNCNNKLGFPLFVNVRGKFNSAYDRDGAPFWSLNLGGITHEGVFASPTLGYGFGGLRNNFQIGINYTVTSFKNYNKSNKVYSYLGLKVGYEF